MNDVLIGFYYKEYNAHGCTDKYYDCSSFKSNCESDKFTDNSSVKEECPQTCEQCTDEQKQPVTCSNNTFLCMNGGTCVNSTSSSSSSSSFNFVCICARGFTGELCQLSIKTNNLLI